MTHRHALLAIAFTLAGCPGPDTHDDAPLADAGTDAGSIDDAPTGDVTESVDAPASADASDLDGGGPDAGVDLPVDCADPAALPPNTRVAALSASGEVLDACAPSGAEGASLFYTVEVPSGAHLAVESFGRLSLRRACEPCEALSPGFYQNTSGAAETLILSVSGPASTDWPAGYPTYATVTGTPTNGSCASAEPLTAPATLTELTTVGATFERFDHGSSSLEEAARYYSVEVPAGGTLSVTVTSSLHLGVGGSPAQAFVLDTCTLSAEQCLAVPGGSPALTRWTNGGDAPRSVIVALASGTALRFTAAFAIALP